MMQYEGISRLKVARVVVGSIAFFAGFYCSTSFAVFGFSKNKSLHELAYAGNLAKLIKVVDKSKGGQINSPSKMAEYLGLSPLALAVSGGHLEVVEYLLTQGAKSEQISTDGISAFLIAVTHSRLDLVNLMLDQLTVKSKLDEALKTELPIRFDNAIDLPKVKPLTPVQIAIFESMSIKIVDLEMDSSRVLPGPLFSEDVLFNKDTGSLASEDRSILLFGAPLHIAAAYCNSTLAKTLIDYGAEVDATRALDFATPLRVALFAGCLPVATLLLDQGADFDLAVYQNEKKPLVFDASSSGDVRIRMKIARALLNGHEQLAWSLILSSSFSSLQGMRSILSEYRASTLAQIQSRKEASYLDLFKDPCSICHGDIEAGFKNVTVTLCSHVFHKDCLDQWLVKKVRCPICNAGILKRR